MFRFRSVSHSLVAVLFCIPRCLEAQSTGIDLSVLGENSLERFRAGWSLTVNDQCLYEFTLQFEHDDSLPLGADNFQGNCSLTDGGSTQDGPPIHDPRRSWERFPFWVWASLGFSHFSLDWYPCGIFSGVAGQAGADGYTTAQYHFSFYRVTPEFRAETMTCTLTEQLLVPGEKICVEQQPVTNDNGLAMFILPSAVVPVGSVDKSSIVNMPIEFDVPVYGAARPHVGMHAFDTSKIPFAPDQWNSLPLFMSTYSGDLAMFQPHVSYRTVSGKTSHFLSNAKRYHKSTVVNLPDSFSVHYDAEAEIIRYTMVGKSQLCREKFEEAKALAGGQPTFLNYDDLSFQQNLTENGGLEGYGGGSSGPTRPGLLLALCFTTASMIWLSIVL